MPLPPSGPAVRPDQKVATVLKEHPSLVDVFVAESSAFERLRNPIMRRTFARMVTVAQAAKVGNVPLPRLLVALNRALGLDVNEEDFEDMAAEESGTRGPQGAPPAWLQTGKVSTELDVRDMQQRGEDPFAVIMDSARHTRAGEILRLRNTFEPMPLYQVLGQKGFVHWSEQLGPQDWVINFYRERVVQIEEDISPPAHAHSPAAGAEPAGAGPEFEGEALFASDIPPGEHLVDAVVTIEMEDLTPPLPMQKVLEGLAPLPPGQLLLVHHRRSPAHLFSKLEEQGHRYRVWDMGPDRKEILIRKAG